MLVEVLDKKTGKVKVIDTTISRRSRTTPTHISGLVCGGNQASTSNKVTKMKLKCYPWGHTRPDYKCWKTYRSAQRRD